jgi:hypothetical protein
MMIRERVVWLREEAPRGFLHAAGFASMKRLKF